MEQELNLDIVGKYLSGNLSAAEEEQLMAWVDEDPDHQAAFTDMVQLWDLTEGYEDSGPTLVLNTTLAWEKVAAKIEAPATVHAPLSIQRTVPQRNTFRWMGIAASLLLLLSLGWWWSRNSGMYREMSAQTAQTERREVVLPDQSVVMLNQNSQIAYEFKEGERRVRLSGEAFFKVKKDAEHPFVISSGEVQTRVLGTSFNVRAYPGEKKVEVTVKTGRVEVSAPRKKAAKKLVLLPKDSGVFSESSEELVKSTVAIEHADAWVMGKVAYDHDTPLREVLPAIERLYHIKVEVANPAILNCPVRGLFGGNVSLHDAMLIVTETNGLQYLQSKEGYLIYGPGCQ
jgi:transmembrane sensor